MARVSAVAAFPTAVAFRTAVEVSSAMGASNIPDIPADVGFTDAVASVMLLTSQLAKGSAVAVVIKNLTF
jgi:hypothetical protein